MSEEAAPVTAPSLGDQQIQTPPAAAAPSQGADWRSILPETVRGDQNFAKYQTVDDFAKAHLSLVSKVGIPSVPIPQDGWTETQWQEYYGKLGRPNKPDEYSIERPQIPEGMQYDEDLEKGFKEWAHAAGISNKQAKALFEGYSKFSLERGAKAGETATQAKAAREQQDAAGVQMLEKEWGDKFTAKFEGAKLALKNLDQSGEVLQTLQAAGLDGHPALIKLFAQIGETFAEDTFRAGGTFRAAMGASKEPSVALAEIGHLKTDQSFQKALMDKNTPGHAEARARWTALHESAYPETTKS